MTAARVDIRGLDSFTGQILNGEHWDGDVDMAGLRVAVIGTDVSLVPIVAALVGGGARVKVFQRTPAWVLPSLPYTNPELVQQILAAFPAVYTVMRTASGVAAPALEQLARLHLRRQVRDPWLRRQLTPHYRLGCRQAQISNDYYPVLQRDNCTLVTWPIAGVVPEGIRTADGIEHHLDCLVLADDPFDEERGSDQHHRGTRYSGD